MTPGTSRTSGTSGTSGTPRPPRLAGLDLARYLALAGMVLVNFHLAMRPAERGAAWLESVFHFLEGKASATFVVLAGVGLALATQSQPVGATWRWTARRALFLLPLGLLNLMIFPADIIHYYAVYFLLALPWLRADAWSLAAGMLAVAAISLFTLLHVDYNQGWNWHTLDYTDLWTPAGFVRNLLFNGFHPVLPWLALLLLGMLLARLPLHRQLVQTALVLGGLALTAVATGIAQLGMDSNWAGLLGTSPIPPGPIYLLMGAGSAACLIGICLRCATLWPQGRWRCLLPAGQMTLSLYLAHILLGMGLLETLGALDGSCSLNQVALASLLFLLLATIAAARWRRHADHGPVEIVMRRWTAPRASA